MESDVDLDPNNSSQIRAYLLDFTHLTKCMSVNPDRLCSWRPPHESVGDCAEGPGRGLHCTKRIARRSFLAPSRLQLLYHRTFPSPKLAARRQCCKSYLEALSSLAIHIHGAELHKAVPGTVRSFEPFHFELCQCHFSRRPPFSSRRAVICATSTGVRLRIRRWVCRTRVLVWVRLPICC